MDYVAYYRVSTKEQGDSGLGLQAQRADVLKFIKKRDNIISEYTEVESGKNCERKKLKEAIGLCYRTNATLLIAKLDRLSRDAAFTLQLMNSGIKFICADMPEANELTIGIMALLAEDEAKRISKRTKASLQAIKENIERDGFHISKAGNKVTQLGGGTFTEKAWKKSAEVRLEKAKTEEARRTYLLIKSYRDQGHTLQQIADRLNSINIKTPKGCMFTSTQVSREINKFER